MKNTVSRLLTATVMLLFVPIFCFGSASASNEENAAQEVADSLITTITADEFYSTRQAEYAKFHIQVTTYGYDKDEIFTIDELNAELERIRASVDLSNYIPEIGAFFIGPPGTGLDYYYLSQGIDYATGEPLDQETIVARMIEYDKILTLQSSEDGT